MFSPQMHYLCSSFMATQEFTLPGVGLLVETNQLDLACPAMQLHGEQQQGPCILSLV